MKALLLLGIAPFAFASSAIAQDHSGHNMPGMTVPAAPAQARPKPKPKAQPAPRRAPAAGPHAGQVAPLSATPPAQPQPGTDPHAGHAMPGMAGEPEQDPHAGHVMPAAQDGAAAAGTDLPPGDATAPAPEPGRAADRYWGAAAMAEAERQVRREHGGGTFSQVMLDLAELRIQSGEEGYRWNGEAWFGGDINRVWIKSEGEGRFGERIESAEVQALYSRAIDPYWNMQGGIRQDLGRGPRRTWATLGVEGLAPYRFEVEGALFLSEKGDLRARAEARYDQRITQDLVLQPRVELNLAARDMPANRIGAGLSDAELGLRLRYERVREFAPYLGVSWEWRFGRTADFARASGDDTGGFSFVLGVRTWF
ncbi:copper resistance protein B [Sphingomonas psychrotolerans]|uniref:Copper resistance protein B n=1 Tax=Sphingomonas psychrotolerans TaxID=1327635 RepID=A0ABU3N9F3_9SPHN|nr:copper resistance protein B [Sphingomonas psychrotolerans]MDT8760509.1 copper resistance protein B [Sphingomonas psychrotolerans]